MLRSSRADIGKRTGIARRFRHGDKIWRELEKRRDPPDVELFVGHGAKDFLANPVTLKQTEQLKQRGYSRGQAGNYGQRRVIKIFLRQEQKQDHSHKTRQERYLERLP